MARIKAIFDADILIHLVETNSTGYALDTLGSIYVSDYVYQQEIKKDTIEGKQIQKLKNAGKIKILEYAKLTKQQKSVYKDTYSLLKKEDISDVPEENPINEGERVTAAFAKACNIYYYMSDDNKASSYIKSLTAVDIVNFCDILFLYFIIFGKAKTGDLRNSYESFVALFDEDKQPRILKNKKGLLTFEEMMAKSFDRFDKNHNLKKLMNNVKENVKIEVLFTSTEL